MADPSDFPMLPSQVLSEQIHLAIPSLPNWIEPTVEYLKTRALLCGACQPTRAGKLVVALQEALSNSLLHGNLELSSELKEAGDNHFAEALARRANDPHLAGRRVDIVMDFDGEVCRWTITDQGKGFDVDEVLARCLSDNPEVLLSSGRGILMMKSFLDDVQFELGGRRVRLSLRRQSGEEKRTETRVPLNMSFQVTPITPDGKVNWAETYEAVSRNFSEHGIGLLQDHLTHTPRVLIGIPTSAEIIYVSAAVKHARALDGGGMELGCSFNEPLSADQLPRMALADAAVQMDEVQRAITGLLDSYQPQQPFPQERRLNPRVVFNESVRIWQESEPEPLAGYARDLSKGGIAFIVQHQLAGEITIAFAAKDNQAPLKVRSRVVRCGRIKDGFFDVGAVFQQLDSTEY